MVAVDRLCSVRCVRRRAYGMPRDHRNAGIHSRAAARTMESGIRVRNSRPVSRRRSRRAHWPCYQNAGARRESEAATGNSRCFRVRTFLQRCHSDNFSGTAVVADNNCRSNGTALVWCATIACLRDRTRASISSPGNCCDRVGENSRQDREVSPPRRGGKRNCSARAVGLFRALCVEPEVRPIQSGQEQKTLPAACSVSGNTGRVPKTADSRHDRGWSCARRIIHHDRTACLRTHDHRLYPGTPQQHGANRLLTAGAIHSRYIDVKSRSAARWSWRRFTGGWLLDCGQGR